MRLNGLVLSGGRSTRMGRDKGALVYRDGLDQRTRCYRILSEVCASTWISCRAEQVSLIPSGLPYVEDAIEGEGPAVGILSAHAMDPEAAWLVLACDFPWADAAAIRHLVQARNPGVAATVYVNDRGILEPLFGIWEVPALQRLRACFDEGNESPREALESLACEEIPSPRPEVLVNVNSIK
jgi:molybdenum cofactor guanylyltransferase